MIVPYALQTPNNRVQDGSHIVEGALVWSIPGHDPVPSLAVRNEKRAVFPVLLEIDGAWHPPGANAQRVKSVAGADNDHVTVLVSGGVVPFDAIRLICVPDVATEVQARLNLPGRTGDAPLPGIRVVPGLFAFHPGEFVPVHAHLENICVTENDHHVGQSVDRLLGALCQSSHALAEGPREAAEMFLDLVRSALGIEEFGSTAVSAIGAELVMEAGSSRRARSTDPDARILSAATKLLSQVAPPSHFVSLHFVQALQDELHRLDTSQGSERSPHVASLDGLIAVLRNETDWDVTISQISDASLLAIAYLVRAGGNFDRLRGNLLSSQVPPEASLLALALSGTLHRLTDTHEPDQPRELMKALIRVVARAVSSAITGGEVPKVSVELRSRPSGPATQEWTLLIDQVVAHEWSGPMRDDERSGTEDNENILVDTDVTAILPAGTGDQRTEGDLTAVSTNVTEGVSRDQLVELSLSRGRIENETRRAYSQVDEGVRLLIKLATVRDETWARLREAEYLPSTDREVKDQRQQRDEADRALERQMRRLLDEYVERDLRRKEWIEVTRDTKQQ